MTKLALFALTLILLFLFSAATAQNCSPPAIVFNAKNENIFTPEQEMYLGDAMMDRLEKDYRVIDDPAVNAYVQSIADRLARHLPAVGIRFRVVVVDTPETNAFTLAGGRIMVTRKLISFVHNEDELAAVIGHELGHAVVRHGAMDMSRYLRQLLGVTSVGDRQDVFDKYNRFLEAIRTKKVGFSNDHENDKQLEADRIGLLAVYNAGYDTSAMVSFWKRLTLAKKVGFFASVFGGSSPDDKRLTEMLSAMRSMPGACVEKLPSTAKAEFDKWKTLVINYSGLGAKESLTGLIKRQPLVPLRPDLTNLRFSPNGQFILAQDNSAITVLRRDPLSVVFRFDVEDAFPASFTSDSKYLVVYNSNLRVQKWNVEEHTLVSTSEIAIRDGYWQTKISPDGRFMACYRYNGDLEIYDVATNDVVFKEREFYLPTSFELFIWQLSMDYLDLSEYPALSLEFSPDGRYFLAGRRYSRGGGTFDRQATIGVDLTTLKKFSIGENIKKVLVSSMDFMGPDKVIGQYSDDYKKSGIFAFPSGERLAQFELAGNSFTANYAGDYVVVRPVSGAAVGLYDLNQKKFLLGNAKPALDGYGKVFVAERRDGEIGLFNVDTREVLGSIALPPSPFGTFRAAMFSTDGNWLVASDRSRGAAWDLRTGERKLHVRNFRGAYVTDDDKAYVDFPKLGKTERSIAVMDPQTGTVNAIGDIVSEATISQTGKYIVVQKAINDQPPKPAPDSSPSPKPDTSEEIKTKPLPSKGVVMEVRDVRNGQLLWKREFANERPAIAISQVYGTMLLGWSLKSAAATQMIDADPSLRARRDRMGSKDGDQFIQAVDPNTGEITGKFLLETGEGSFAPDSVRLAGDYLVVNDNRNRILVYSISSGELLTRFFGNYPAVSPDSKQISIENSPGHVALYDIESGKEFGRLAFEHPVVFMQFMNRGSKLFVVTSDQTVYSFDTEKIGHVDTGPVGESNRQKP